MNPPKAASSIQREKLGMPKCRRKVHSTNALRAASTGIPLKPFPISGSHSRPKPPERRRRQRSCVRQRHLSTGRLALALFVLTIPAGCASIDASVQRHYVFNQSRFEPVGVIDFRSDSLEDFQRMVQPGDLIVNYMRLGRAARKRQWLFAILPHGHAMIVLDPYDPKGILECRFHGTRRVGPEELKLYSYNNIYRLDQGERLDLQRLGEFADAGTKCCRSYRFSSWLGRNGNLVPNDLADIPKSYTCSTMVVAAYHYAGLTLDLAELARNRVITPRAIAASRGRFNAFSLPGAEPVADFAPNVPNADTIPLQ